MCGGFTRAAVAALLHHTWPFMISTCVGHGTTAAALWALFFATVPLRVSVRLCDSLCTRYVCVECVLSQNQYTAAAKQQQYNDSRVSRSCVCASSHGECIVGPHTRYTKHTAVAKTVAHTYHWDACIHLSRLAALPGYQVNPVPKGDLVQRQWMHELGCRVGRSGGGIPPNMGRSPVLSLPRPPFILKNKGLSTPYKSNPVPPPPLPPPPYAPKTETFPSLPNKGTLTRLPPPLPPYAYSKSRKIPVGLRSYPTQRPPAI